MVIRPFPGLNDRSKIHKRALFFSPSIISSLFDRTVRKDLCTALILDLLAKKGQVKAAKTALNPYFKPNESTECGSLNHNYIWR